MATILIADDDKHLGKVLARALKAEGHEAILALNGPEALELATSRSPDLVILDVALPLMTGDQVALGMRAVPALARVPVLFISGRDRERLEPVLDLLGPCGFLPKPVDLDAVLGAVKSRLG